ncbi:MAG: MSMEG_0570 family nitrogen starvation response protein [Cyclobacteriaceae bacterium]
MPVVYLKVQYPDDEKEDIYSPSSVIRSFFSAGESLSVGDFEARISEALETASSRVAQVYGYECTAAMGELARVSRKLKTHDPAAKIEILGLN